VQVIDPGHVEPERPSEFFAGAHGGSIGIRLGTVSRTASGDLLEGRQARSASSKAFGFGLDVFQSRVFALGLGVTYTERGASFGFSGSDGQVNIDEQIKYIQVPLTFRFGYQWAASLLTVRLFSRFGCGLDVALEKGGDASVGGAPATVKEGYYKDHHDVNVAVIYGGGLDFGFGDERRLFVGVELLGDQHLLPEWGSSRWDGKQNLKYHGFTTALALKYEFGD
jgi:hypothetical protein